MNGPVGWAGLAVSLLLVAVAAAISRWQHLGLHRQILIAAARALAPADQIYQLRDGHLTGAPAKQARR